VEIRRIEVQGQPRQEVRETPSQPTRSQGHATNKLGASDPSYKGDVGRRITV
jgi:hypothetical protein